MIVQYTAAAIVNDLASRAHPASVYSIPTSANAEDHVSMGANEARHVLAMADDLGKVLALELYTAAQALDLRRDMINAARELARAQPMPRRWRAKVQGGPLPDACRRATAFLAEVEGLRAELAAGRRVPSGRCRRRARMRRIREAIPFLDRDRALDGEVATAVRAGRGRQVLAARDCVTYPSCRTGVRAAGCSREISRPSSRPDRLRRLRAPSVRTQSRPSALAAYSASSARCSACVDAALPVRASAPTVHADAGA